MRMSIYGLYGDVYGVSMMNKHFWLQGICLTDPNMVLMTAADGFEYTEEEKDSDQVLVKDLMVWLLIYDIVRGERKSWEYYLDIPNKAIYLGEKEIENYNYRIVWNSETGHHYLTERLSEAYHGNVSI